MQFYSVAAMLATCQQTSAALELAALVISLACISLSIADSVTGDRVVLFARQRC